MQRLQELVGRVHRAGTRSTRRSSCSRTPTSWTTRRGTSSSTHSGSSMSAPGWSSSPAATRLRSPRRPRLPAPSSRAGSARRRRPARPRPPDLRTPSDPRRRARRAGRPCRRQPAVPDRTGAGPDGVGRSDRAADARWRGSSPPASIDWPTDDRRLLRHARRARRPLPARPGPSRCCPTSCRRSPTRGSWRRLAEFIVTDQDDLRFSHSLLREVAYEGLPFARRRLVHRRFAETLEMQPGQADSLRLGLLALHYDLAGMHREAYRYCRRAGERASHDGANLEATSLLERAIENARRRCGDMPPERLGRGRRVVGRRRRAGRPIRHGGDRGAATRQITAP